MYEKILNLGCGTDVMEGAINVDIVKLEGVDKVLDLNDTLPFDDESIDKIYAKDIIEHLDDSMRFIGDCYRVLKKGGVLLITVVYYTHRYAWGDPQHKRAFSEVYFEFFVGKRRSYYLDYEFADLNLKFNYDGDQIQGMEVTLTK